MRALRMLRVYRARGVDVDLALSLAATHIERRREGGRGRGGERDGGRETLCPW